MGALVLVLLLALLVSPKGVVASGPPCRFFGSVTIDGQPAEKGTAIRVWLQEGANTTWEREIETGTNPAGQPIPDDSYLLDVPARDPGVPGAQEGDTVYFSVEGMPAQTGSWVSGGFIEHDLSVPIPAEPTIAFTPSSLSFSAIQGGTNPANQTLEIWNSGAGTLNWGVSDSAAWLSLAPTSGSSAGEHDEVTASVDIAGMSAGVYSATITIAAAGAINTPGTLAVSLTITETEAPTIAIGPASLSFNAVAGQANPANKTLEIWNSGTGTLDWSVSDDAAWLALTPISGSSTGDQDVVTVAASVDITGMTAGSYPATITITAAGATNTPRTASVSLQISEGANGTAKSVATATGTGTALFVSSQGSIEQLASIDEASLPQEGKPNLEFPQGFFSFNIVGIAPGDEVEVQITLPDSVPPDAEYWAYYDNEWHQIPMLMDSDDDRVITITLVDGGLGDGDGMADGAITDAGGPGYPSPVDGGAHQLSKGAIVAISIAGGAAIIAGIVLLVRRRRSTLI